MEIILASGSPRRKELLALITPHYRVETSDVDEESLTAETPALLAQVLGTAKAQAVSRLYPQSLVIGCDTVVDVHGQVYGKPQNTAHARAMLQALSGITHQVHTGVCLVHGTQQTHFVVTSQVTFCPLSEEEIEAYIATPEPYDKAGGYGIQGLAAKFVQRIDGCYFNIMGLPVARLYQAMKEMGAV